MPGLSRAFEVVALATTLRLSQQSVHIESAGSSDVHLSVGDGRNGKLHGNAGLVAGNILGAVVEFPREVGGVIDMKDSRTTLGCTEHP